MPRKTSIVILTYNKLDYTKLCIESIRSYTEVGTYEIIVVDNHSQDGTVEWLKQQPDLRLILNGKNEGFPRGCNQGIEIAAGDMILLLNNDTVVTTNWLKQLEDCLYSEEDIGAVGPVTNFCSYGQSIPVTYQTLTEMQEFSSEFNQLDPSKWEERLKLIGFCMLIKKEVVNKIGGLDEIFTPGNYEDDDYSLRIRREGYRLLLCKDTFIHHFGSISWREDVSEFGNLLNVNRSKFEVKWGFNPDQAFEVQTGLLDLIQFPVGRELHILEVGCGAGGTLLELKNRLKRVRLYGIEQNENAGTIASAFAAVRAVDLETMDLLFFEEYFDYIIVTHYFEHAKQPEKLLRSLIRYLKPTGNLVAAIQNRLHYRVVWNYLNGNSPLSKDKAHFFTLAEIEQLFCQCGFQEVAFAKQVSSPSDTDRNYVDKLAELCVPASASELETTQYLVQAQKGISRMEPTPAEAEPVLQAHCRELIFVLRRIENGIGMDENIQTVIRMLAKNETSVETISTLVENEVFKKVELLNRLAISCYQVAQYDFILPLLNQALQWEPHHADTLYNLGYILYRLKEYQLAGHYLQQIVVKDTEVLELLNNVKEEALS